MNQSYLRKPLTHLTIIFLFAAVCYITFAPSLGNKSLVQSDLTQAAGMAKEASDYHKKTGEIILWTNSMFGGMPTYFIFTGETSSNLLTNISGVLSKIFPDWAYVLFLFMVGFYILMLVLGVKPVIAAIGSLTYTFTSYNIISLEAGHINKLLAMAMMAPTLAGIFLILKKRYLAGTALTALFLTLEIAYNHVQISYYLGLLILIIWLTFGISSLKKKAFPSFLKSSLFMLLAAFLALLPNSSTLITTYLYSKETIRGSASEITSEKGQEKENKSGLDKDYATSWSYGIGESFTMLVPGLYGSSSHEELGKKSNFYEVLIDNQVPPSQAKQYIKQVPLYWGNQPFTSGPVYAGAIVLLLLGMALALPGSTEKWGLIAAGVLGLFLSWGKNFSAFTDLFFYYAPLYNKFRTPSMTLSIVILVVNVLGFQALQTIYYKAKPKPLLKALTISGGIIIGILLILLLFGSSFMSFTGTSDTQMQQPIVNALIDDRKALFLKDVLRTLFFIGVSSLLLWFYLKSKLKVGTFIAAIGILSFADVWMVSHRYLNVTDFKSKKEENKIFEPTPADIEILKDTDPNFRVLNASGNAFNEAVTSYHHKSVGGYHPAKLRRYQDLIEYQLSKFNPAVLNMLNTKYFVVPSEQGGGESVVQRNPTALGNAWFVKNYTIVKDASEEMKMLNYDSSNRFNPHETAFIHQKYSHYLSGFQPHYDSIASIKLTHYSPMDLNYESNASKEQLAVFSEIYYNPKNLDGWSAYIDGKAAPYFCADYVLRAMRIPPGKHTVEFKFSTDRYSQRRVMSLAGSWVVIVLLASAAFAEIGKAIKKKRI